MNDDKIVRCNHCMNIFRESEIIVKTKVLHPSGKPKEIAIEHCPRCGKHGGLMDME